MIGTCLKAGTLILALASGTAEAPMSSLVLVLNVISDSHARPATGVVIRSAAPAVALVLVPADFVAAGDEIVVLDGGTDIRRHGRSTRTVARSAQAGVALLEVAGLERPGVELSSNPWPPDGAAGFEFAAWPAAEALAQGAPLIRRSLELKGGTIEPAAPAVSGPLFDRCGRLAALHLAGDEGRLVHAGTVADYLRSAGFETVQAPCAAAQEVVPAADGAPDRLEPPAAEPAQQDPAPIGLPTADTPVAHFKGPAWAWAGALVVVGGVAVYLGLRARRRRPRLWLEGSDAGHRGSRLELRFTPPGKVALLQREGRSLAFELKGGRVLVSDRGGEGVAQLVLAVGGTPCLPGEVFIADPGREIRIGAQMWRLQPHRKVAP